MIASGGASVVIPGSRFGSPQLSSANGDQLKVSAVTLSLH